jgi:hypothetical protein
MLDKGDSLPCSILIITQKSAVVTFYVVENDATAIIVFMVLWE